MSGRKNGVRILMIAVLVLTSSMMPGCIVFRTAGKIVGTGVKTVGKVIQAVIPG